MKIEYEFSIKKIGNSFGKANVLIYCHMPDGAEYSAFEKKILIKSNIKKLFQLCKIEYI